MSVSTKQIQPEIQPTEKKSETKIRARAIILGLALIPAIGYWLFEGEMVRYTFTTWAAPFYNAIYVLFLLTVLNLAIEKFLKWQFLNNLELLCVYVIISVASALLSTDLLGILITLMGYPSHFATDSNGWNTLFQGVLPQWLTVTDGAALKAYYEGNSSFMVKEHIMAWLMPSLYWMIFIAALFISYSSLSVLLRKQWTDSERLTFPIVQLPIAMTEAPRKFFSDRLMWLGVLISGSITILNGIHYLYPTVPGIPINRRDFPVFNTAPWNAIGSIRIAFYFFAITLGFLMPLDLSVSSWLFYFLYLGQKVMASAMGFEPRTGVPFPEDQATGAFIAIGIFVTWGMRKQLIAAFKTAFMGENKGSDWDEPASYRTAYIGLALSLVVMYIFIRKTGMSLGITFLFMASLIVAAIVISRIRCEVGFPVHNLDGFGPQFALIRLIGAENMNPSTLGSLSMLSWTGRAYRSHPMPHEMEGLKLAGSGRSARRSMFYAIVLAGLITIPICFWVYLDRFYVVGAGTARVGPWSLGYGAEVFPRLDSWLKNPAPVIPMRYLGLIGGAVIAVGLSIARTRILGFPLHPIGYAMANSWGMFNLWLPIMIGSICKAAVLKAGGLKSYRKATMFFFGLMLGEFVVGCSWTLLGMLLNIRTYDFWP